MQTEEKQRWGAGGGVMQVKLTENTEQRQVREETNGAQQKRAVRSIKRQRADISEKLFHKPSHLF